MKFNIIKDKMLSGNIFYYPDDYAFGTNPYPPFWNSVLVDNLEIMLDIEGRITGVWGYCPQTCWKKNKLYLPFFVNGGIICDKFHEYDTHIPTRIAKNWNVFYDQDINWIRIGTENAKFDNIQVLSGLIFSLYKNNLKSVWIKLQFGE